MLPYESLSLRGQVQRMRALAWEALAQYAVRVTRLKFLGWFTNLMFRVDTAEGDPYVLRICSPGWRTVGDLQAEVMWLCALESEPEIGAPVLMPSRTGERIVHAMAAGVPGERRCILMSWIPGVSLGKHLSEPNLEKMGVLFARLHLQAGGWTPPQGFSTRRMDRVLARQEPEALFGGPPAGAITPSIWQTWERARSLVQQAYARRYALPGLRVIHHDLWHDNIKLHRGRLHPLDFEDTVWGYPVQDIAMALQDLMEVVPAERYEPLLAALRGGYERLLPWPEAFESEIDTFRAGRMLWVANYVARFQGAHLKEHLERLAPQLERFFATGKLRLS
jgi:Ser/Thr protein kinase RdoA (MazF antagonist)